MDENHFQWKNYDLGYELRIAGNFIYDGLKILEETEFIVDKLNGSENIFNFMYNISVGIERLQKICIILLENEESTNQKEFVKSIKNHNHHMLMDRIKKKCKIKIDFNKEINVFISELNVFYNNNRYMRYEVKNVLEEYEDVNLLKYLAKYRAESVDLHASLNRNSDNIKIFLGEVIGTITNILFKILETEARRLDIYSDDLSIIHPKSLKIFGAKTFTFIEERQNWKEVLIYILSNITKEHSGSLEWQELKEYIVEIEPLNFSDSLKELFEVFEFNVQHHQFAGNIRERSQLDFEEWSESEIEERKQRVDNIDKIFSGR